MEWNSDKPDEGTPELGTTYKVMLAGDYTLTYDAGGKLIAVKGFDAMLQKLLETFPEEQRDGMASVYAAMSDKGMLRSLRSNDTFYPSKPVSVGETWDSTTRTQMGKNDMVTTTKHTLMGVSKDQIATIAGTGTVEMKPHEKVEGEEEFDTNPMMAAFDVKVSDGKTSIEVTIDLQKGIVTRSTTKQSMTMELGRGGTGVVSRTEASTTTTQELMPAEKSEPGNNGDHSKEK
jgi:hypothetical protein